MQLDRNLARALRAPHGDNHARRPHATVVSLVAGIILALGLGATPVLAAQTSSVPCDSSTSSPAEDVSAAAATTPCLTEAADEVTVQYPAEFAGPAAVVVAAPALSVAPMACDLLGASDVRVSASALGAGTYTVTATSGGSPVTGVSPGTLTASASTTILADLPNGATYDVVLTDPTGRAIVSTSVTLVSCDLPTLDVSLHAETVPGTVPAATDSTDTTTAQAGSSTTLAQTGQTVDQLIPLAFGALLLGVLLSVAGMVIRRRASAR